MPALNEIVRNSPLSSAELAKLIREDFERVMSQFHEAQHNAAYPRVSYELLLVLHVDNSLYPMLDFNYRSRRKSNQEVTVDPALAGIEAFPLNPAPRISGTAAEELSRVIDSPNQERLRTGIPIPVDIPQRDGSTIRENMIYPIPKEGEPGYVGDGAVTIEDVTERERAKHGLPSSPVLLVPDAVLNSAATPNAPKDAEIIAEQERVAALKTFGESAVGESRAVGESPRNTEGSQRAAELLESLAGGVAPAPEVANAEAEADAEAKRQELLADALGGVRAGTSPYDYERDKG